ncbi:MAG: nitroreductase family protein [Muribaculaceae bacterium]|nr:nitroreductase family protein [Muribaculaceae bacterium]
MTKLTDYPTFYNLICERYSCRAYDPTREVGDDMIKAVIEAAQLAPSACNKQPWTFVVVRDEATRHALLAKSRPAFKEAPVLIAAVGNHSDVWHRPADGKDHLDVDVSIAVEHICLAATTLGLGSCWI